MIRTYLEFEVGPGKADALAQFFKRRQILATSIAQQGCHSAELTISEDGRSAIVTATWDNQHAYDRWVTRGDRQDLARELNTYLARPVAVETRARLFHVALNGAA